jgi:biopolymer transport protein ExbB
MSEYDNSISLLDLLMQGGWAMYPLGMLSMALLYLAIFSWQQTRRNLYEQPEVTERLAAAFQSADPEIIKQEWALLKPGLQKALCGLKDMLADSRIKNTRESLTETLHEQLERWESGIGQWIHYMNVIAATSPMVGLLGTVSGMISAFQTIAAGGMGKPELLAGDIGEALVTTATGLVIGIPAMVLYFYLRNRLDQRTQQIQQIAQQWIDHHVAATQAFEPGS